MERDVFISHASTDVAAAELLVRSLEQRGITCWISTRDIGMGADYAQAIIDGIRGSRALITLLSKSAIASRNVTREVERAHALDLPLLTVRIEDVNPTGSLEYFLASRQFVDAFPSLEAQADTVAATVSEALGDAPPTSHTPRSLPEPPSAHSWREPPLTIIAGAAAVLLLVVIAAFAFGGNDDPDEAQSTTTQLAGTTTTGDDEPTTVQSDPEKPLAQLFGPTEIGQFDQSWFWLEAPDEATVTYTFGGNKYPGREFWMRPDVAGPGSITVTATGEGLDFRQDVEYNAVARSEADNACYLMTSGEIQDLLGATRVTRLIPEQGLNNCEWGYTAGEFEGVVDLAWHRQASGDARLMWFLGAANAQVLDSNLDETVYRGVGFGKVRMMAQTPNGVVEVGVPGTVSGADALALDVLRLLIERVASNTTAPAVGCELLTSRDLDLLIGVSMTRQPVTDPQVCFYNSALETGLVVSVARHDGIDPAAAIDDLTESETPIILEFRELEGIGDRAIIGESSIIAFATAVQGNTSIVVSVGKTVTNHDVSALAIQLITAALSLI